MHTTFRSSKCSTPSCSHM